MSKGKPWSSSYKESSKKGCPNGKKKCWLCSNPDLSQYKLDKCSPLSDSLLDLDGYAG